jgi:sugar lactone lactonase YvrE
MSSSVLGVTVGAGVAVVVMAGLTAALRIDVWGEHGSGLTPPFTYDLEKFQKTDPALVGYRETGRIAVKMIEPRGIAVGPEDRIYVAGDRLVHVFTPAGQRLQAIALEAGPRALAVGGPHHKLPGRIYVAMKSHVEVYDPQGQRQAAWESPGEDALFTSIAVAESDVYVADARGRIVLRYSPEGKRLGSIGARDDLRQIPGFVIPSPFFDVAVAPDGLLRVTNPGGHRIEAYTPGGDLEQHWGQASFAIQGFSGCCNPVNIAILPDGRVVTAEKGIPRVKVYTGEGEFVCVVAGPESLLPNRAANEETRTDFKLRVVDLAADSRGRILILDPATRSVRIFEAKPGSRAGAADPSAAKHLNIKDH